MTTYIESDELGEYRDAGLIKSARAVECTDAYVATQCGLDRYKLTRLTIPTGPFYILIITMTDGREFVDSIDTDSDYPRFFNDLNGVFRYCYYTMDIRSFEVVGHE